MKRNKIESERSENIVPSQPRQAPAVSTVYPNPNYPLSPQRSVHVTSGGTDRSTPGAPVHICKLSARYTIPFPPTTCVLPHAVTVSAVPQALNSIHVEKGERWQRDRTNERQAKVRHQQYGLDQNQNRNTSQHTKKKKTSSSSHLS